MNRFWCLLVMVTSLIVPNGAGAGVTVGCACVDGDVTCSVNVFNPPEPYDYDWLGVVLFRSHNGVCETGDLVDPAPLPLPAPGTEITYTVVEPVPEIDQWFVYRAYFTDGQGEYAPAPGQGDPLPWHMAMCGEAILSRGYLVSVYGNHGVWEICPQTCWFWADGIDLTNLDPASYLPYVGLPIPLDVWGIPSIDGMPGGMGIYATAIAPTSDGDCTGAIPDHSQSWGRLKSTYR